jgi:hypothetical protein
MWHLYKAGAISSRGVATFSQLSDNTQSHNMGKWTNPAYRDILTKHLEAYVKAKADQRSDVIDSIRQQINNLANEQGEIPPDHLSQVSCHVPGIKAS